MINYKEARAGNIVMYDNRLFQIEAISRSLPCLNTDEFGIGVVDWNNLQPIVLSPEILEKCGFEKYGRDDMPRTLSYELGEFRIFPSNSFCDFEGYGYIHYKLPKFENNKDESARFKFKYFHQLQNLYFALTGEELNYTP